MKNKSFLLILIVLLCTSDFYSQSPNSYTYTGKPRFQILTKRNNIPLPFRRVDRCINPCDLSLFVSAISTETIRLSPSGEMRKIVENSSVTERYFCIPKTRMMMSAIPPMIVRLAIMMPCEVCGLCRSYLFLQKLHCPRPDYSPQPLCIPVQFSEKFRRPFGSSETEILRATHELFPAHRA